ncbi:hypothetical protein ACOZ4N_15925 [Halorientalis pallida]|uniref:hypothetical protein n=1 Tax=Halorientalis pallida TaxID=2479928 RepID=UPI003C6F31CE
MVSLSNLGFAVAGALTVGVIWFLRGVVTSLGDQAATKLTSKITASQLVVSETSISDEELDYITEQFCTTLARRLHNRDEASYRPVIDPENPLESALEQREHDLETIEKVYEDAEGKSMMPSFAEVRDGFAERGIWDEELTTLYEDAESTADLRELLIRLENLRDKL